MGSIVPAVIPIAPDPVVVAGMAQQAAFEAALEAASSTTSKGVSGMRLGCTAQGLCADQAYNGMPMRGRDVDYGIVGLAGGIGDFVSALFSVPQNPIVPGMAGMGDFVPGSFAVPQNPISTGNGIVNGLAGLRGLGAIDTSSLANFMTSVESGTTTLFGIAIPNWALVGGGAALLFMAVSGGATTGRRR